MSDLKAIVVASVNGTGLSVHELLHTLKLRGQLPCLVGAALAEKVIASEASKEGIRVSDEELQRAADAFRLRRGLHKAADARRWLALNGLKPEDLEEGLERDLVWQKMADKVTRDQVEKTFAEDRTKFDRVRLRHIVVDKEGVAQELLSRIQEDGADFAELARQHSSDPQARATGGNPGLLSRADMPPAMEAAVFNAKNGAVVGPLKTDRGFVLIQVEEILRGHLDGPTAAVIQQNLFGHWIAQHLRNAKLELNSGI